MKYFESQENKRKVATVVLSVLLLALVAVLIIQNAF